MNTWHSGMSTAVVARRAALEAEWDGGFPLDERAWAANYYTVRDLLIASILENLGIDGEVLSDREEHGLVDVLGDVLGEVGIDMPLSENELLDMVLHPEVVSSACGWWLTVCCPARLVRMISAHQYDESLRECIEAAERRIEEWERC